MGSGQPAAPTPETICTEALRRFYNGGLPSSEEITRAIDYGLEKVKRDIMLMGKTWRPLIKTIYEKTTGREYEYDNPEDFAEGFSFGLIVDDAVIPLKFMLFKIYDMYQHPSIPGKPARWTIIPGDSGVTLVGLYPTPDDEYNYRYRYYADLCKLDMDEDLYSTILRRWAAILEQGIYVWALDHYDDDRYASQEEIYRNMLISLMAHDLDGLDQEKFQKVVMPQQGGGSG